MPNDILRNVISIYNVDYNNNDGDYYKGVVSV